MIPSREHPQPITYRVKPSRLHSGTWDGERLVNEGDICASYSGDRIAENQPVRAPFEWQGSYWVCVGMVGRAGVQNEASAYRLVPEKHFEGAPLPYRARTQTEELCEAARNDPMGSYHGVLVRHKGKSFVLSGPEGTFVPEETATSDATPSAVQLGLF